MNRKYILVKNPDMVLFHFHSENPMDPKHPCLNYPAPIVEETAANPGMLVCMDMDDPLTRKRHARMVEMDLVLGEVAEQELSEDMLEALHAGYWVTTEEDLLPVTKH